MSSKSTGTMIALLAASTLVALALLITQAPNPIGKEPQTVPYVDLDKYKGTWFEQSVIPYFWERGCTKTQPTYTPNPDGKSVRVDNKCLRNGNWVESVGKAIPQDATNAKLKVEFVQTLDIGAAYWVVRLPEDYSWVVISDNKYKYLWIMSRTPHMDETLYQSIVEDLKKDDFPVDQLRRTEQ